MVVGRIAERITTAATRRTVARRLAALDPCATLRDELEEWTAEHGDRLALAASDGSERLGHRDLAARAARWSRWAILHGIGPGEPVAVVVEPRPERFAAILGLAQIGAVPSLPETTAEAVALAAALDRIAARHVVVDAALLSFFEAAAPHLTSLAAVWVHGPHPMAYPRLDDALDDLSPERLRPADRRALAPTDVALAVAGAEAIRRIDHRGAVRALHAVAAAASLRPADRLAVIEPTRLGLEAVLAPGVALTVGAPAVFAATRAPGLSATVLAGETTALVGVEDVERFRRRIALGGAPDPTTAADLVWAGALTTASGRPIWPGGTTTAV